MRNKRKEGRKWEGGREGTREEGGRRKEGRKIKVKKTKGSCR